MKKIWSYIAIFFAGFSTMAVIALKWFAGDSYSLQIKKIKSKNSDGDVVTPITVEVPETSNKKPKRSRKQRRLDRKAKKL